MPYNVYLVDTMNCVGSDERRNSVKAALQFYFDAIVKQAKFGGGAIVSFAAANPQPKDHELMVYFCSETGTWSRSFRAPRRSISRPAAA